MLHDLKIDELLDKVDSRYGLAVASAKRARQINEYTATLGLNDALGIPGPQVHTRSQHPLSIAIEELREDKLEIGFRMPPEENEEAEYLSVPVHSPAFLFERTTQSEQGEVVEFVRSVYRGDRYRLVTELRPALRKRGRKGCRPRERGRRGTSASSAGTGDASNLPAPRAGQEDG